MTTYNTGNALGSSDARDLYDNAENIDRFANGSANTYQDRLGITRKSLAGMNAAFDDFIESSGYTVPVAYTSGIVLSAYNQLIEYNDEFYKLKAGQAPYTTTGTWGTDSAKLVAVGDAALRQELAAGDGASKIGYQLTGGVVRDVAWKLVEFVSVKDFGAVGDGVTDDTAAIQAAIDYAETISTAFSRGAEVLFPPGEYVTNASLVVGANGVKLRGSGITSTIIRFTGSSGAAVQADGVLRTACRVEGMTIRQDTAGGNGIDFTWFSYSDFENLAFDMRAATQVGIYAAGNGLGTGPYYNTFDKIQIIGQPATAGQIGVQLAPASSGGFLADGPNANLFSNFRRVASVDVGFDIQSGNGNLGTNISIESIRNYGFAFNNRPADYTGTATSGTISSFTDAAAPFVTAGLAGGAWKIVGGAGSGESGTIRTATTTTITGEYYTRTGTVLDNTSQYEVYKTKAQGNKFDNIRMEGANTSAVARFYPGALTNTINNCHITSISTTLWVKDVAEGSNWCHTQASGQLIAVPMWKEGSLTAGTTHGLNPNTTTGVGSGFRFLPKGANVVGMSVSCDSLSGVVGSATVRLFKSNVAFTDLDVTLNTNTVFGNHSYLQTYITNTGARFEPQHDMDVRIITDGSWNGTARQISVLLWVQV